MRNKLYIALCGLPDSGKSTFIKHFTKHMTNRDVALDSLCNEEVDEMTIRSAQVVCRLPNRNSDIVFLDCPGHLEFIDEIRSCLTKAHVIIFIKNRKLYDFQDIDEYESKIIGILQEFRQYSSLGINDTMTYPKFFHLYSNDWTQMDDPIYYDVEDSASMDRMCNYLERQLSPLMLSDEPLVDPETTAKRIIAQMVNHAKNPCAMVSYGKDSLVMLALADFIGVKDKIKWYYPVSGFDMDGLSSEFIKTVNEFFGVKIEPYRVIPEDPEWTFETKTVQEMMLKKAQMLNEQIARGKHDYCMMGIRRDEEGVRAKEKFFSRRKNDGSANLYEQQLEIFNNEDSGLPTRVSDDEHIRVHPLLDVTEADAWIFIKEHNIPFCSEYVSKNGKRYRSLGDKPITSPIDSDAQTIEQIVEEVTWTLVPERACRAAQDNAVRHNMEIIRGRGFF